MKEYLAAREVAFESMNVASDPAAMDALLALGARSVPVVSKGDRFVFAQVVKDVTDFLGIGDAGLEKLPPAELAARVDVVLDKAAGLIRQVPDAHLADKLPNRDRAFRVLFHHIFRIPEAFLEAVEGGSELTHASLVAPPPDDMETVADITAYGETVRQRFAAWWAGLDAATRMAEQSVATYYGSHSMHEVLERTTWHSCQHVRQVIFILDRLGIAPERPLAEADMAGLPLPKDVWDG